MLEALLRGVRVRQSMVKAALEDDEGLDRPDLNGRSSLDDSVPDAVATLWGVLDVSGEDWHRGQSFAEGRRVLSEDGIGSVVFAHKTTEGWEALLAGMIHGDRTITGSWLVATEMGTRLRA